MSDVFESDYLSDDDVEAAIDSLVFTIKSTEAHDKQKTSVIDPFRIEQVAYVYKAMKYMMRGQNVKVEYQLHKPFENMGYVRLTGKSISFKKYNWFLTAVKVANNFEVIAREDGNVEMNFSFHGLLRRI